MAALDRLRQQLVVELADEVDENRLLDVGMPGDQAGVGAHHPERHVPITGTAPERYTLDPAPELGCLCC